MELRTGRHQGRSPYICWHPLGATQQFLGYFVASHDAAATAQNPFLNYLMASFHILAGQSKLLEIQSGRLDLFELKKDSKIKILLDSFIDVQPAN